MPSPIGHALAGIVVAWVGGPDASPRGETTKPFTWLTLVCCGLAVIPDLDLMVPFPFHRTATHSVLAAVLVTIVTAGVTGWVTGQVSWATALVCGAAFLSHLVLDWAGADDNPPFGVQPFWPFDGRWFISPWVVCPGTERQDLLSWRTLVINLKALVAEVAMFGPVVAVLWIRRRRRSRAPISVPVDQPRPSA